MIAVIAILLAIAVPGWLKSRQGARAKACIENLSQISGAVSRWAIEEQKTTGDPAPTVADLANTSAGYLRKEIFCPAGNVSYVVPNVGTDPVCPNSLPDHILP